MNARTILPAMAPLLLAACNAFHIESSPTSNYALGAPAAATVGANPPTDPAEGLELATNGGPTFTGASGGLPPAGTVFALTQSAYMFPSNGGSADTNTMADGATMTVENLADGTFELKIPGLGIDATVVDDGQSQTTLPNGNTLVFGLNGDGQTGTVLADLNYTALGFWAVQDASTGAVINTAYYVAGYQTPPAGMPHSGTATYGGVGTVEGQVILPNQGGSAQLTGDSSLTANFGSGAITGEFTNMTATPSDGAPAAPWNNVNITASISGTSFGGTTATSSNPGGNYSMGNGKGTIEGGFYGPSANELGAVWTLYDGSKAAIGGVAGPQIPSDRRLKRDIRFLETTANGVRLYRFRYLGGTRSFVGVMAQDLIDDPRFVAAVSRRASGLMVVDYARLGLHVGDADAMREEGQAAIEAWEMRAAA